MEGIEYIEAGNRGNDFLSGTAGDDIVPDFELGVDIAVVDGTVTMTDTGGSDTPFYFNDGSSIRFENVTMDSSDLLMA